ncbi:MAG: hypothetical protein UX20_C0016G0026 [Candidatus Magasanikbacteria bacterium GW2011_GWC2_45_8]|nr:MAG: hypothetical protein UX20_C0016G0026 [Candidatus Magasanikbacteria bacterium GW2011_GWC2_45_8]
MPRVFKFFLPFFVLLIFTPFPARADFGYCQCTLSDGINVKMSAASLDCSGVNSLSVAKLRNLTGDQVKIFSSCVEINKSDTWSLCTCKLQDGLGSISNRRTPSQNDCSVLSSYFIKNNFSTDQCVWKIPKGYKPDDSGDIAKKIEWKPVAPSLAINIPGFKGFSSPTPQQEDDVKVVYISFLGEYLAALYRFLISIAGIISAVMIMIGGFQWIAAGGNSSQRASALERIEGALVGLALVIVSYLVLYIINPDLVRFQSLRIPVVENVPFEDAEFPTRGELIGTPKALSNTTYDTLFQKFAGCIGMDWRVYKVLAFHESRLNPAAKSSKSSATGLFQVLKGYCPKILQKVGWDGYCSNPGLTNPAVSAAIVTQGHFKMALNSINGTCGSASANDKLHMLLFNNGSGPGALRKAIRNYGCDTKNWEAHPEIFKAASYANGVKTVNMMRGMGVQNLTGAKDTSQCPFNTGAKPSDFPS